MPPGRFGHPPPPCLGKRALRRLESASEPSFDDDSEVVEWGGELYWAADFTSCGAPVGLTLEEMRAATMSGSDEGWARAKRVLDMLVEGSPGRAVSHIDRVRKIGDGSSHEVFAASVEVDPDPVGRTGSYSVLIPARGAESAPSSDPWRAWELLDHIAEQTQAIRVATIKAIVPTRDGRVIVRRYLEGIPLDPAPGARTASAPGMCSGGSPPRFMRSTPAVCRRSLGTRRAGLTGRRSSPASTSCPSCAMRTPGPSTTSRPRSRRACCMASCLQSRHIPYRLKCTRAGGTSWWLRES